MNHRERVLAAIRHQPVDRLPTDMTAAPEVQEQLFRRFGIRRQAPPGPACGPHPLLAHLGRDAAALIELWDILDIDGILVIYPPYIGSYAHMEGDVYINEWGIGYRAQGYGAGQYDEVVLNPLASCETIADLEAFRWPDPDAFDYSALPRLVGECGGRAVCLGWMAPFYYHNLMRGMELSLMDPVLRPEFTHYLMGRITDFLVELHRRALEATRGLVDMVHVSDDYGSMRGLLISPRIFDEFYRPYLQRCIDLVKSHGVLVCHHDDGDIRRLLPRLVDMGIDILNPVQWRCGDWDLSVLKAQFGHRICFHGGGDVQQTVPFGTPADVRAEIKRLISELASDGTGYIVGPGHSLQPGTPTENIIALYEAAREYGRVGS